MLTDKCILTCIQSFKVFKMFTSECLIILIPGCQNYLVTGGHSQGGLKERDKVWNLCHVESGPADIHTLAQIQLWMDHEGGAVTESGQAICLLVRFPGKPQAII